MRLLHYCKLFLLISCCTVFSLQAMAVPGYHEQQDADKLIIQLYHSLNNKPTLDMPTRIVTISTQFLGKPYLLGALGEGIQGDYDQMPLYRADAFDCETYVDTVLALALANDLNQFQQCINQVRYHDGHVSFIERNHFTGLDWNKNNQYQGFGKDITTTFLDKHQKPVVQLAHALIDKPSWYHHMSTAAIRLHTAESIDKAKRLASLKQEGNQLPRVISTVPYIPLTALFDNTGKANVYLFNQLPHAAIIEIIRPNWDLSHEIGTHLNVSHLGFVVWDKHTLLYRSASSAHGGVVDVPLIAYLRETLKSPTIKGINVQIVVPPHREHSKRCGGRKTA